MNLRNAFFIVLILLSLLAGISNFSVPCAADILYRHDGSPAMVGKFIQETDRQIIFLEHFKSGATKKQTLFKADVLQLVRTIDDEKLAQLKPESPRAYFEYAEELSAYKLDFVAQQLAIRLFLIAAKNSKNQLRQSSLLALHALFSSETQKRRTRALAFLTLQPRYHRPFVVNQRPNQLKPEERDKLLEIVRKIRNGKQSEAAQALKTDEMRSAMNRLSRFATWNSLYKIAISKQPKLDQILFLVKLEIAIIEIDTEQVEPVGFRWFLDAKRTDDFQTEWITFSNLTKFDPDLSVFKDGKWVKPTTR